VGWLWSIAWGVLMICDKRSGSIEETTSLLWYCRFTGVRCDYFYRCWSSWSSQSKWFNGCMLVLSNQAKTIPIWKIAMQEQLTKKTLKHSNILHHSIPIVYVVINLSWFL
jgi:hypothetical protein